MRKYLRRVAHARMKKAGIAKPNRRYGKGEKSYFAKYWRDYVD